MSDDEIVRYARNREALSLYGWHPYMHNPQTLARTDQGSDPRAVGREDGIVSRSYGRAYSALIPGARFGRIEDAGHHPEIEQPDAFVDHVLAFLET